MSYSEGSYALDYPGLEDNIYWRRRREICFWAICGNVSVEKITIPWAGSTIWSSADKRTRDGLRDLAKLWQWLSVLAHIPESTRHRWAVEYESL